MDPTKQVVTYNNGTKYTNLLGILSCVFGGLGAALGLLLMLGALAPDESIEARVFYVLMILIFWVIPHVFFIISGIKLIKLPTPGEAKGLAITTIVLGALWNLILLAFAIVALTHLQEYEASYSVDKKDENPSI